LAVIAATTFAKSSSARKTPSPFNENTRTSKEDSGLAVPGSEVSETIR
jgi:hypothetical protein